MLTVLIVIVTAAAGGSCGLAVNRRSVARRQAKAKQLAKRSRLANRQNDRLRRGQVIRQDRSIVQKYVRNTNDELNSQVDDNLALKKRLQNRSRFLMQNEARLHKLKVAYQKHRQRFKDVQQRYHQIQKRAGRLITKRHQMLNNISQMDDQTAKRIVLNRTAAELKREKDIDVKEAGEEAAEVADQKANDIIVEAIQRGPLDRPRNHIERSINVPDYMTRRQLLNHEKQHLRLIESATGTDLFFDPDDKLLLHIFTHDPIRRETARRALSNLIVSRHVTDSNIEVQSRNAKREVDEELRRIGEQVVKEMQLGWMHPDLMKIVGRLKFRTSYGQNVLYHSMEVGQMTGVMAAELGLDPRLARRAGLLHDVGKSIDHEVTGTHVELGVKLAKIYHENPIVVNAIAAHHGDVEPTNPISLLVSTSDALSGARPGARSESIEEYIQRLKNLENIANQQKGVKESYAIQAGRELRVIIDPRVLNDAQSAKLTDHIRDRIQDELSYPGKIKVTTIRTLKAIQYIGGYYHHRHHYHRRYHRRAAD